MVGITSSLVDPNTICEYTGKNDKYEIYVVGNIYEKPNLFHMDTTEEFIEAIEERLKQGNKIVKHG